MTDYPKAVTEELERLGRVVTSAVPGGPEDAETVTVTVKGWPDTTTLWAHRALPVLARYPDGHMATPAYEKEVCGALEDAGAVHVAPEDDQQPKITAADLMAACDEVEVSCHPTEHKRAAAARARGAKRVAELVALYEQRNEPQVRAWQVRDELQSIAEALRFEPVEHDAARERQAINALHRRDLGSSEPD